MNVFYNASFDVVPGSSNRSVPVEGEFAAIGAGFDKVEALLARALLVPALETVGVIPALADRRNKSFVWDALGNPSASTFATSAEMDAAVAAASSASASAATASAAAASVASLNSYIQQLMVSQGVI